MGPGRSLMLVAVMMAASAMAGNAAPGGPFEVSAPATAGSDPWASALQDPQTQGRCTGCPAGQGRGYLTSFLGYFTTGWNLIFGGLFGEGGGGGGGEGGGTGGGEGAGAGGRGSNSGSRVSYRRHQLLRALPRSEEQVDELESLMDDSDGLQFWTRPVFNQTTDIVAPPDLVKDLKEFLLERGIEFTVLMKDIQKVIVEQNPKLSKEKRAELRGVRGHEMTFRRYHRYGDMLRYMQYLTVKYPSLVEVLTIGQSSKGRPLKVAKVTAGSHVTKQGDPKPAIWIDGGMHAREWISPAVAMYTLKQLVENYKVNRRIVEAADWYIMPVGNPDGYEYTHTTDRLWRKTRSKHSERRRRAARFFWESCVGVDPNRNWDFHWGEKGASDDPCHETYAGPKPFSEPETRAVADFLMDRRERVKLFLTLHSYSQMWLLPWGYTYRRAPDYEDMMMMGKKAVETISKVGGTRYQVGAATKLLYPTSGGSDDWAKGVAGIKYAYTVELRDKGDYGFLLPASQIVPTGRETFAAIKTLVRAIACKQ